MHLLTRLALALALTCSLLTGPLRAETPQAEKPADNSSITKMASTITAVTGMAISPLLGTAGYGLYLDLFGAKTDAEKQKLPWFAKSTFYIPALLIVLLVACKDSLGAIVPPGLKKPLDVLETTENKLSGLVATGAIVPITLSTFTGLFTAQADPTGSTLAGTGLAMTHLGAIDGNSILGLLAVPFTLTVYAVVWMASHAINVLVLLSPWGAIDAALKTGRTALLGLGASAAALDPRISAILSVIIIIIAYFVAGWAFRLTVFGSLFCWDFFTLRKKRFTPHPSENWAFSAGALPGVPVRTYGRIVRDIESGGLRFNYKPWLVLPEKSTTVKPASLCVGEGLFVSTIRRTDDNLFTLPPRYRGHEPAIVALYQLSGGVQPAGLLKAWSALGDLFRGSSKPAHQT